MDHEIIELRGLIETKDVDSSDDDNDGNNNENNDVNNGKNDDILENNDLIYKDSNELRINLIEAVLNNNKDVIPSILQFYSQLGKPDDLRYYKYNHEYNAKPFVNSILIIACVDDRVKAETLGTLFHEIKLKFGSIECTDETKFGWEPLHYIASIANIPKLEALLNVVQDDVNSLTYFSENALHVLLQYEKTTKHFAAILHNSRESRSTNIIGTEKEVIVQCAKLLINKGVDINQTNFWNETPVCLAIRYRYTEVVKLLLGVDYLDLDSFRECGKTIRDYLKWNFYITVPKSYIQEDPIRIRFNFLKSDDEDSFLTYSTDNFNDHVNALDGKDSYTMLQFCLRKGFLKYLQDEQYKIKRLVNYDIRDNPMLIVFKGKGFGRSINYLLDNGADTSITTNKFKENVLEYSCVRGYFPFVAILLHHKNTKINIDDIFNALSKITRINYDLNHQEFYINCVLYLLLNKLIFLFRQTRDKMTPKKKNILNKLLYTLNLEVNDRNLNSSEIIYQILHLGASLTYRGNFDKMVIDRLNQSLLKSHFDDCIHNTRFIYNSVIQDENNVYDENKTLEFLVNNNNKQVLLTHPLLVYLVRKKWSRIYWVFYVDLLFYILLSLSIYGYMIYQHFGLNVQSLNIFYFILVAFHTFKESIQLVFLYRYKYFLEPTNLLEAATIVCCLVTTFVPNIYSAVASILFSTFIFFLLIGQLPLFTKYTVIFSSIRYFFQYMAFYSVQFVAFSICFYLVFPFKNDDISNLRNNITGPNWNEIPQSLFYTLIYFTGEFSDRVLEPTEHPVFGRLLMTIFIFCMTIILNNLLVGFIVADMNDIQQSGRLYKQIKLVRFIHSTNILIKRLHDYKFLKLIKKVIRYLNVFHKGREKEFENVDIHEFDVENIKYLKDIKNNNVFNRHMLKDIYNIVFEK